MPDISLFRLDGKTAAVIGAGSGIGAAVAAGAAAHGACVVCLDIDEAAAHAVALAIGPPATSYPLDIREGARVSDTFNRLVRDHQRLDIVVCTPSINVRKPILQYTEEDFDRVVTLNLKGSFNVVQSAGRVMTAQRSGSIIVFSSIRSQVVEPGQSVYAATKAGIVQLVKAAAAEFGPFGVRVNAIGPGIVDTALTSQIKSDPDWYRAYAEKSVLGRWASAEEIVGPTLFLASEAASFVTGTILMADGGWTAADGRFTPPGM
jgi:NAD(P)-dependent dehydrogenase (short-subunit alcohol dehydrogenase family)